MPIRLLVADECRFCLHGIQATLRDAPDFAVVGTTCDGEAVVQMAVALRPDILLLDTELRTTNGLSAMARVHDANPAIRGVFLSKRDSERWEHLAREAGAVAWIHKDTSDAVLFGILRDVYAGRAQPAVRAPAPERLPPGRIVTPLSPKEIGVLRQAVRGLTSREIAAIVCCAPRTVDKHLESVRRKFGVAHAKAVIPIGLVYLQYLDLRADEERRDQRP